MESMLIYIIVIVVLLIFALWAVSLLPIPEPAFAKPLLMFLCVCVAGFAIARKAGML